MYVGLIINDEHCIITWLRTLLTPLQDTLSLSVQSSATMSDYFISCLSTRNSAGSDEKLLIGLVCKYLGCPCKIGCYSGVKACIKGNQSQPRNVLNFFVSTNVTGEGNQVKSLTFRDGNRRPKSSTRGHCGLSEQVNRPKIVH